MQILFSCHADPSVAMPVSISDDSDDRVPYVFHNFTVTRHGGGRNNLPGSPHSKKDNVPHAEGIVHGSNDYTITCVGRVPHVFNNFTVNGHGGGEDIIPQHPQTEGDNVPHSEQTGDASVDVTKYTILGVGLDPLAPNETPAAGGVKHL